MATWDLNPGNNWASIINAHTGSTEIFLVKAGTHTAQTAPLRSGQKLLFEGGVTVSGNSTLEGLGLETNKPDGIEVAGLVPGSRPDIHSFVPGFQRAVIRAFTGGQWIGKDWYVHDLIVRDSGSGLNGWGVDMGESMILRRCDISGCKKAGVNWSGWNGVTGATTGVPATSFDNYLTGGGLIDDCDIHHNGIGGSGDNGGVAKIAVGAKGRKIMNSRFYGNSKSNIWCDFLAWHNNGDGLGVAGRWSEGWLEIVNCDIYDLAGTDQHKSVFLEVSGGTWLHHCRLYDNWSPGGAGVDGAQVICHNAGYNTIEDNIIYHCGTRAAGVMQSDRYNLNELITCERNIFRRNKIYAIDSSTTIAMGLAGYRATPVGSGNYNLKQDGSGGTWNVLTQGNNQFIGNEYYILDSLPQSKWYWNTGTVSWAQWQALGHDVGGSYSTFSAGATPPLPPMPDAGGGGGEPPPPPPPPPEGGGGGPLPAAVRVGAQVIMPVQSRF